MANAGTKTAKEFDFDTWEVPKKKEELAAQAKLIITSKCSQSIADVLLIGKVLDAVALGFGEKGGIKRDKYNDLRLGLEYSASRQYIRFYKDSRIRENRELWPKLPTAVRTLFKISTLKGEFDKEGPFKAVIDKVSPTITSERVQEIALGFKVKKEVTGTSGVVIMVDDMELAELREMVEESLATMMDQNPKAGFVLGEVTKARISKTTLNKPIAAFRAMQDPKSVESGAKLYWKVAQRRKAKKDAAAAEDTGSSERSKYKSNNQTVIPKGEPDVAEAV